MTAPTWWSDPAAGDIVPAGPGSVTAHLFAGNETLSADVAVRLHAVDIGATVASIELVADNVEGGRPGRAILAELTANDAAMLAAALLAAAGLTRASEQAAGLADSLRPIDRAWSDALHRTPLLVLDRRGHCRTCPPCLSDHGWTHCPRHLTNPETLAPKEAPE